MHPYMLQEIARQRQEDLRRAARRYRPATAARTIRPGGEPMRSKPKILVALLLAALTAITLTKGITAEWKDPS